MTETFAFLGVAILSNGHFVIITNVYLDPLTQAPFFGGEQRIYQELIKHVHARNWKVVVIQGAQQQPWTKTLENGVEVYAGLRKKYWGNISKACFAKAMLNSCLPKAGHPEIIISSYPDYLHNLTSREVWLYQHGVDWDCHSEKSQRKILSSHLKILPKLSGIIAVDTNYPNVIASNLDMEKIQNFYKKIRFVPNFQHLKPTPLPPIKEEGLRFLFPRNLVTARGIFLVAEAAAQLWSNGLKFHLTLCGESISSDSLEAIKLRQQLQHWEQVGVLTYKHYPFHLMQEAYEQCHVVLVPTLASEGTSLSCLEAFGVGRPVISTWVGGLQSLISDGVNGRMIRPNSRDLEEVMTNIILNKDDLLKLSQGALTTALRFTKQKWDLSINEWLDETIARIQ